MLTLEGYNNRGSGTHTRVKTAKIKLNHYNKSQHQGNDAFLYIVIDINH